MPTPLGVSFLPLLPRNVTPIKGEPLLGVIRQSRQHCEIFAQRNAGWWAKFAQVRMT